MLIYLQLIENENDKIEFEHIYSEYRNQMFYIARKILRDEYDAEDAVQQALLSLIKNFSFIKTLSTEKMRAYIFTTVERKAIDISRQERRPEELHEEFEKGLEIPPPCESVLADALAKLPARYREAIMLRFDLGYTTKEVAQFFNLSQDSAQKMIWRAKRTLAQVLNTKEEKV